MKNQRKKGSGLTETYSRIEGIGDIANGLLGVATGKGDLASIGKGAAKFLVGKSLAKASDVDFLIEQGFKELAKQYGNNGNVTTNTTPTPTAPTTRTTTEVTEDIDVGENPTDLTATEEVVDQEVTTTPKKKTTKKKTSKKGLDENQVSSKTAADSIEEGIQQAKKDAEAYLESKKISKEQADNIRKQWDKLTYEGYENEEYMDEIAQGIDEYSRTVKQIEDSIEDMQSDLLKRDADNYESSDFYYGDVDSYEEWADGLREDIKKDEETLRKVNEKYNKELEDLIDSLPLDYNTKEMIYTNMRTEGTAGLRAIDAFIKDDGEEANKLFKSVEGAYNRHQNTNYDLNRRNNDTSWMDEEQYAEYRKSYNEAVETDYSRTLKDYIEK